jgi:hypothetical protein
MSRTKDKLSDKTKWQRALAEAERQIGQYKRKIVELTNSVKIIRDKIAAGAPWPE